MNQNKRNECSTKGEALDENSKKRRLGADRKGRFRSGPQSTSGTGAGEEIEIVTVTGRKDKGVLVDVNPRYIHDYGDFQPELLQIELQLKNIMRGDEN